MMLICVDFWNEVILRKRNRKFLVDLLYLSSGSNRWMRIESASFLGCEVK